MQRLKKRTKIEQRKLFAVEEKQKMLNKSKGVCSHCGKKVKIGENFTVEHVVPLSEGGTNDEDNLVALCADCNLEKQSIVFDIDTYYKYLSKPAKKTVKEYFDKWLSQFECISATNLCSVDRVNFTEYIATNRGKPIKKPSFICKAIYSDLDELYEMLLQHGVKDAKKYISFYFENGCIYIKRSTNGYISYAFMCQFVYARKRLNYHVERVPMLFMKEFVNPKLFNVGWLSQSLVADSAIDAISSIHSDLSSSVNSLCGAYAIPVLAIRDTEFNVDVPKSVLNVGFSAKSIDKQVIYVLSASNYVSDTDWYKDFKRQFLEYKKKHALNDFQWGIMLSNPAELNREFLQDNWVGCLEFYQKLGIFELDRYLGKYCSLMSLKDVLKISVSKEQYESVCNYLSSLAFALSEEDTFVREEFTLKVEEIVIPEGINKSEVLPTFIKSAIKMGEVRRVRVDANNVLSCDKHNYAMYKYYKDVKTKNIPCYRKTKIDKPM